MNDLDEVYNEVKKQYEDKFQITWLIMPRLMMVRDCLSVKKLRINTTLRPFLIFRRMLQMYALRSRENLMKEKIVFLP
ncbi:MAG: hypothetical protein PUA69_08815 [Erysipelotrichaceae bacterium]|nr:hypothetical protein [Erysipelotrichaceae bacterium]